jgi:hypothetical protein
MPGRRRLALHAIFAVATAFSRVRARARGRSCLLSDALGRSTRSDRVQEPEPIPDRADAALGVRLVFSELIEKGATRRPRVASTLFWLMPRLTALSALFIVLAPYDRRLGDPRCDRSLAVGSQVLFPIVALLSVRDRGRDPQHLQPLSRFRRSPVVWNAAIIVGLVIRSCRQTMNTKLRAASILVATVIQTLLRSPIARDRARGERSAC